MLFARTALARQRFGRRGTAAPAGRSRWAALGVWALLVASLAGSITAASSGRANVAALERERYDKTVTDVVTATSLTLRRHTDFMVVLTSMLAAHPDMTNREFREWMTGADVFRRYSGGVAYAYVHMVPHTGLDAFKDVLRADPWGQLASSGAIPITPAGKRDFYCLARFAQMLPGASPYAALPMGYDLCGPGIVNGLAGTNPVPAAQLFRMMGDTGQLFARVMDSRSGLIAMGMPVYEGGGVPKTVEGRRAALRGLAIGTFTLKPVLQEGLGEHHDLKVDLLYRSLSENKTIPVATAGTAPEGASVRDVPIDAETTWTFRVTGRPGSATTYFWIILTACLVLTALVQMLAWSRRRALRLVERRTEELRHQASHDPLTGLPNRALITERIEAALERHRREGGDLAVMFLDLDGFKQINDTLGHAVGDDLLRAVAGRLSGLVREGGSVGRLGGDEFVILVEDVRDGAAEQVASRICAALEQPFRLEDTDPLVVHSRASIGIAVGLRDTAEAFIHDADIALYQAKQSGKGHYKVFVPSR